MSEKELEVLRAKREVYEAVLDMLWELKGKFESDDVKWKQIRAIIRTVEYQAKMVNWAVETREKTQ